MILRLETGSDKLDLSYGNIFLADEYQPKTPDIDMSGINWISPNSDNLDYKDVTDVISVIVRGTCMSDMYDTISRLDRFISRIRTNVTYLMYRPKKYDGGTTWRSRIKSALTTRTGPIQDGDRGFYMRIDIAVTRYPYWEGELTAAPLYYGGDVTSNDHEDVYNNSGTFNTSTHYNWIYVGADGSADTNPVESDRIGGDVPTPAKITIFNLSAAHDVEDVFISLNTISDIPTTSHPHVLEAENSTYVSNVADSGSSSGDAYGRMTAATTLATSMQKTMDGTRLAQLNGNYFRVMLFFKTAPTANTTAKMYIKSDVTVLAESNTIILDTNIIQEVCSFRLPPFIDDYTNLADLTFNLCFTNTSGSYTVELDAVYLMPLNGWRKLVRFGGSGVQVTDRLVDDGIEGRTYVLVGGSEKQFNYTSYGDKIMIYPHKINQLFFMFREVIDAHDPGGSLRVYVDYRPRKITL